MLDCRKQVTSALSTGGPWGFHARHHQNEGTHTETPSQAQCTICFEDMSGQAVVGAPCGHGPHIVSNMPFELDQQRHLAGPLFQDADVPYAG